MGRKKKIQKLEDTIRLSKEKLKNICSIDDSDSGTGWKFVEFGSLIKSRTLISFSIYKRVV